MLTTTKISQYKSVSDSVSLAKLGGQKFTIVKVEDSNYEDHGEVSKGVKITTKESYDIEGKKQNKFHSTRYAIVNKLCDVKVRADLDSGKEIGPMKTELVKAKKGGKDYFDLLDA